MSDKYKTIAESIIELSGGKSNISHALHCATRVRFNVINLEAVNTEKIKEVPGVLGVMIVGNQVQIIIGTEVNYVFNEVVKQLDETSESIEYTTQTQTQTPTQAPKNDKNIFKSIGLGILDGLSGTMGPVIPAIVACAFFKMLSAILGPDLLNILPLESDLSTLFTFVGDAGFYFFPVIVGYTAAKKFGVTPVLGILLGAILMHPTLIQMVNEGTQFTVYGLPVYMTNYSGSIIPTIMSVWVMSYVERFFNKYIPSSIRSVFAPAFTIMVMLPLTLTLIGPAGAILGNYVVNGLLGLQNYVGFLGIAIIAALYPILVMTGMHMVLITALFQIFATQGWDGFAAPALCYASFSVMGVGIGAFFRLKDKSQKSLAASYAITAIVAGTSEPTIYGICTRYKKPFIGLMVGGFAGGLYGGMMNVISATLVPSSSVTATLAFVGESTSNVVHGIIASLISLVVAAICTYFFGFNKDEVGLRG